MSHKHSSTIRELALEQVRAGATYASIQLALGISKSTLSYWVNHEGLQRDRSKQLKDLQYARERSAVVKRAQKQARLAKAEQVGFKIAEVIPMGRAEIVKTILAMLYWAEGNKTGDSLKFTNTDPDLMKLYIFLVRTAYDIDESSFRVGLHVHHYHDHASVIQYWSQALSIPESQFWKIYVKKRSMTGKRFRRNFMGICHLYYGSSAIQRELLAIGKALARRIHH